MPFITHQNIFDRHWQSHVVDKVPLPVLTAKGITFGDTPAGGCLPELHPARKSDSIIHAVINEIWADITFESLEGSQALVSQLNSAGMSESACEQVAHRNCLYIPGSNEWMEQQRINAELFSAVSSVAESLMPRAEVLFESLSCIICGMLTTETDEQLLVVADEIQHGLFSYRRMLKQRARK